MKKIVKQYCYFTIPIITLIIFIIIYLTKIITFSDIFINDISTLITIAGTLIGFLLTAMTVFLSLPKNTELMQRIKKYNHHVIFSRFNSIYLML